MICVGSRFGGLHARLVLFNLFLKGCDEIMICVGSRFGGLYASHFVQPFLKVAVNGISVSSRARYADTSSCSTLLKVVVKL